MKMLIDAADRGGIVMLARIAMLRALNRGKADPVIASRHKQTKAYRIVK